MSCKRSDKFECEAIKGIGVSTITTKAKRAVKQGHLAKGELYLPDSPEKRKRLSEATKSRYAFEQLKAPVLDWKRK